MLIFYAIVTNAVIENTPGQHDAGLFDPVNDREILSRFPLDVLPWLNIIDTANFSEKRCLF